ncbi:MAG: restriction endonuclease [Chloroflexi bacterium]|nr:restriction endonuclease [Chloroflexota bacterium]
MIKSIPQLTLSEYETVSLPAAQLSAQTGELLWKLLDQNGKKLRVEFPSPKTDHTWQVTAQGWVGQLTLPHQISLTIMSRVAISRLFQLWEVAYDLRLGYLLDNLTAVNSIPAFFSNLAHILAQRVILRGRQGFQRAYLKQTAVLPYVRGRLLTNQLINNSSTVQLPCHFATQTADIPDNQILTYTLYQIARSGQCSPMAQTAVRRAYHALQPMTTLRPFQPNDCLKRSYSRLNQDYAVMHALCRFFLEHTGPQLAQGTEPMPSFLLNMAQLYERFVANWLKAHLPPPYRIKAQENTTIGPNDELRFQIDLTLYAENSSPLAVLDTKYKTPDKPSSADISQVITYAKAKGCNQAILIYPQPLPKPLHLQVGDVHLHTLAFGLDGNLDAAGTQFINQLQQWLHL